MVTTRPLVDRSWSFSDLSTKDTNYASHGYHRYPAKFIPQIVNRILQDYSKPNDVVLDPFGGCGTTSLECLLNSRHSISIDINRVAVMISKAKTNHLSNGVLRRKNEVLLNKLQRQKSRRDCYPSAHQRLKYWFKRSQYNKLMRIYLALESESNPKYRLFYKVCFSNILKQCSIWYSKSIKPMQDPSKLNINPQESFERHLSYMTKRNKEFGNLISKSDTGSNKCSVSHGDARRLTLRNSEVDLIVTSPPYVTSYEYADIHQLSSLWFKHVHDVVKMKKDFVGTLISSEEHSNIVLPSLKRTVKKIKKFDGRLSRQVNNYFHDIDGCYSEMNRVLKKNGYLALIIGNTEYKGVKIDNLGISAELLKNHGFKIRKIIKRKLSSKIFTPYRNKAGKFASPQNSTRRVYQYEYVAIAQKK